MHFRRKLLNVINTRTPGGSHRTRTFGIPPIRRDRRSCMARDVATTRKRRWRDEFERKYWVCFISCENGGLRFSDYWNNGKIVISKVAIACETPGVFLTFDLNSLVISPGDTTVKTAVFARLFIHLFLSDQLSHHRKVWPIAGLGRI